MNPLKNNVQETIFSPTKATINSKGIYAFLCVMFLFVIEAFPKIVSDSVMYTGSKIVKSKSYTFDGPLNNYVTNNKTCTFKKSQFRVKLALKRDLPIDEFSITYKLNVKLKIISFDFKSQSEYPYTVYLDVNHNNKNVEQNVDVFVTEDKTYSINVEVTDITCSNSKITNPENYVNLILESTTDFTEPFDATSFPTVVKTDNTTQAGLKNNILLNWSSVPGAEMYEVQWLWLTKYGFASQELTVNQIPVYPTIFDKNATSVKILSNEYKIPLIYEEGYIIYRVRAIGASSLGKGLYEFGAWSNGNALSTAKYLSDLPYHTVNPHEANMNWQMSMNFAEEGKKKANIQYFDGSSRQRQAVTLVNTQDETVVGETLYDLEGRPSINILPVPTNDNELKYYSNFNTVSVNTPYTTDYFDKSTACDPAILPLSSTSGAGNYYSPSNPQANKNDKNNYIPDAKGYPFTQTVYTNDNTGRISKASNVGSDFIIGSGKETEYYYTKPLQSELDRLFGTDAGDASHYKKNVVFDANGQASVTYLDINGKTVATSLSGTKPNNLQKLDENVDVTLTDNDILVGNAKEINSKELKTEFSYDIVSTKTNNDYTFSYSLDYPSVFEIVCPNDKTKKVSFEMLFDLQFIVRNECGVEINYTNQSAPMREVLLSGVGIDAKKIIQNIRDNSYKPTMDASALKNSPQKYTSTGITANFGIGKYTITRILKVNKEAYDRFLKYYMNEYNCLFDLSKMIDDYIKKYAALKCNSCTVCKDNIANKSTYNDKRIAAGMAPVSDEEFAELKKSCDEVCDTLITNCDAAKKAMMADLKPSGQYAGLKLVKDEPSGIEYLKGTDLSIFKTDSLLWQKYDFSVNGVSDSITVAYFDGKYSPELDPTITGYIAPPTGDGIKKVSPRLLKHIEDFIVFWKDEWAETFVPLHPEYKLYTQCIDIEQKSAFVKRWSSFDIPKSSNIDTINNPLNYDSFFNPISPDPEITALKAIMSDRIQQYAINGGQNITMVQTAYATVKCPSIIDYTNPGVCTCDINTMPKTFDLNDSYTSKAWVIYQQFYLSLREEFVNAYKLNQAIRGGYYNGCIGDTLFKPTKDNYIYYLDVPSAQKGYLPDYLPPNVTQYALNQSYYHHWWQYGYGWWYYNGSNWRTWLIQNAVNRASNYSIYYKPIISGATNLCNSTNYTQYKKKTPVFTLSPTTMNDATGVGFDNSKCEFDPLKGLNFEKNGIVEFKYYYELKPRDCSAAMLSFSKIAKEKATIEYVDNCKECPSGHNLATFFNGLYQNKAFVNTTDLLLLNCYPKSGIEAYSPDFQSDLGLTPNMNTANYKTDEFSDNTFKGSVVFGQTQNQTTTPAPFNFVVKMAPTYEVLGNYGKITKSFKWSDVTEFCCVSYMKDLTDAKIFSQSELAAHPGERFYMYVKVNYTDNYIDDNNKTTVVNLSDKILVEGYTNKIQLNSCNYVKCSQTAVGEELTSFLRLMSTSIFDASNDQNKIDIKVLLNASKIEMYPTYTNVYPAINSNPTEKNEGLEFSYLGENLKKALINGGSTPEKYVLIRSTSTVNNKEMITFTLSALDNSDAVIGNPITITLANEDSKLISSILSNDLTNLWLISANKQLVNFADKANNYNIVNLNKSALFDAEFKTIDNNTPPKFTYPYTKGKLNCITNIDINSCEVHGYGF